MPTVIRNARILSTEPWPAASDIVIDDGTIESIQPAGRISPGAGEEVDVEGALTIPGFFNAHAHNHEIYMKGLYHGMPLEPYILYVSPRNPKRSGLSPEDLYNRTLATCADMLLNGVTSVADDYAHVSLDREDIEAVLTAYRDSGMRARVSIVVENSPWSRSVPYSGPPDPLLDEIRHDPETALRAYEEVANDWASHPRVRPMVSPSAPQRCSPDFLKSLVAFAREAQLPFHVHIQETLAQYVVGPKMFAGKSMVRFMFDNGLLGPETTIAHAVWIDDDDLRAIADAGANVVHNPISNMKLGSGAARVREMRKAGINVTLGTDGLTCNDALDMFEVSKGAALLSCIADPRPETWLSPHEVIEMATLAGARANLFDNVGRIEEGQRADLVFLDPMSLSMIPRNDAAAQTVFSARSRDVLHVTVDGEFVVQNRRCTTIDVAAVNNHVLNAAEAYWAEARASVEDNLRLLPGVMRAYGDCVHELPGRDQYRLVPNSHPVDPEGAMKLAEPQRPLRKGSD
jgi:5-methylthioadenosine/S-adenosylhomocysteine deaminase